MPDEDACGADIAKTALAGREAEFDVFIVSASIKLRQTSDGVKAGAGYKQTEADAGRHVDGLKPLARKAASSIATISSCDGNGLAVFGRG